MAFPTYPVNGQVTVLNGIQYTYTSATNSWSRNPTSPLVVTVPTGNAMVYTAATSPPSSGNLPGALWYNTATDILYKYTYDGVNYVWVDEDSSTVNVATGVTTYTGNNTTIVSGTLYINNAATTVGGNLNVSGNITTTGANIVATSGNIGFVNALFSGSNTVSGNLNITGNVIGNISNGIVTTVANSAASFGYVGVPQNTQSTNYTVVATDAGKQVYLSTSANVTIPSNASLPFPIGTILTVITGPNITANILTGGDTFIYAGGTSIGTRTLTGNSIASCFKTTSTNWLITGSGVS
jgi:cytoskeletal protein CcmA (bactofilin family)